MWEFRHKVRILVSCMLAQRRPGRHLSPSPAADWLPPVLCPEDWSILADRSAGWYFDRR